MSSYNHNWIREVDPLEAQGGGIGSPGGSDTEIQFNESGAFGGFGSWDGTTAVIPGNITASLNGDTGNLYYGGLEFSGLAGFEAMGGYEFYVGVINVLALDLNVDGSANFGGNSTWFSFVPQVDGLSIYLEFFNADKTAYIDSVLEANSFLFNTGPDGLVHALTLNEDGSATLAGTLTAPAVVFPDADPHVAGAAYWVAGVLTKSAG